MHIEISNFAGITFHSQKTDGTNKSSSKKLTRTSSFEAKLRSEYAPYIKKAISYEHNRSAIPQTGNKEMISEHIDTPQSIKKAAENILKFGF